MIRFTIICAFMLVGKAYAQEDFKNSLQIEGLGNGYYYSINYERIFPKQMPAKIGFMLIKRGFAIPILVGKYFGNSPNHFELLGGATYAYYNPVKPENLKEFESSWAATLFIGYRYQQAQGRFLFRVGYTPIYDGDLFFNWGGLSFGYRF